MPTPDDGLTPADRQIICGTLARYPAVDRAVLFGSRAMGTFSRGSDIDLALEGEELDQGTLSRIAGELEDSRLPFKVDLLHRKASLAPEVEKHIRKYGRTFYPRCDDAQQSADMLEERKESRLSDYADVIMGYSPPGETCNRNGEGMPLLNGPTEFGAHHPVPAQYTIEPRRIANPGDVLFCVRGSTTGRMNWADQTYAIGRGIAAIRHRKGLQFQPFLRGVIENGLRILLGHATGSTFPSLSREDIANMKVPKLLEPHQLLIASILGSLDDKIEQNRRTSRALERLARAIFRAWFVDFEPVKAKAAGATAFPSMPQEVFDALPTRLVDSELGPIPEGWEVKSVSEACEVNPRMKLAKGEPAPYLDMKNMPTTGHAPAAWIERPVGSGAKFTNGDTLVARITPCLENGKTAFVDFLEENVVGWGSTEYIVLRPRAPLPPIYAYCLARTAEFRDYAIQNMSGTSGRQRVPPTAMDHFIVAVPNSETATAFGDIVQSLFNHVRAGMSESRKLAEMRDYLLPKLLSGEVRVRDAEHAATEAGA